MKTAIGVFTFVSSITLLSFDFNIIGGISFVFSLYILDELTFKSE